MMLAIIDLYYNAKQNVYVEQLGSWSGMDLAVNMKI